MSDIPLPRPRPRPSPPVEILPVRPWPPKRDTPDVTVDAGADVDDRPPVPDGGTERSPVEWLLGAFLVALVLLAVRSLATARPRTARRPTALVQHR